MQQIAKALLPDRRPFTAAKVSTILAIVVLGSSVAACTKESAARSEPAAARVASVAKDSTPEVLAMVGDAKITLTDVHSRAAETMDQLDNQYRRMRDKLIGSTLDSMVRERFITDEAKKQGKTPDDVLSAEIGRSVNPTDADVAAWYKDNPNRVGGRAIELIRSQIADLLRAERRKEGADKLERRLMTEKRVVVNFEPYRPTFANEGAPTLGKKDAPVTLVEFSDFQCPYCQSAAPILKQVNEKFGDKVLIVYRQYPIPSLHPFALKAAEASLCANEQGKFWELHDVMFKDQKKLAVADLKATARELGMDGKKFDACLNSGKYVEQVQNDQKEGQRLGVNGTPAMFINGVYVEGGSVPFSTLEDKILKELDRVKR